MPSSRLFTATCTWNRFMMPSVCVEVMAHSATTQLAPLQQFSVR